MAAEIVHLLNNGVYGYFVLVVALGCIARRCERVGLVNDEEGLPGLASLLGDNIKDLIKQCAHLANFARAADARAELEQHRFLACFARQPVTRTLCRRRLPVPTSPAKMTSGYTRVQPSNWAETDRATDVVVAEAPFQVDKKGSSTEHRAQDPQVLPTNAAKLPLKKPVLIAICVLALLSLSVTNDYVRNVCFVQNAEWRSDLSRDHWVSDSNLTFDLNYNRITIPANAWAAPQRFDGTPLSDFLLRFRLSFAKPGKQPGVRAEWVLRSKIPLNEPQISMARIPGYHFQLIQKGDGSLVIRGSIVSATGVTEVLDPQYEEHPIGTSGCCDAKQSLQVYATVIGGRITHCRVLEDSSTEPASKEVGDPTWESLNGFVDRSNTSALGSFVLGAPGYDIAVSNIAIRRPSARELLRCFLSGRLCLRLEDRTSCF